VNAVFAWIDRRVAVPNEPEIERVRKRIIVVIATIGTAAFFAYGVGYALFGYWQASLQVIAEAIFFGANLILFLQWQRFHIFIWVALVSFLVILTLEHFALGGFLHSGAVWVYCLFGPLVALLAGNRRLGVVTVTACLLLTILFVFLEPQLRLSGAYVLENVSGILFGVNISGVTIFTFVTTLLIVSEVEEARTRADQLLLNILPGPIAEQLKRRRETIADGFDEVTVLFADIVDFTRMSANADPRNVVNMLNDIFSDFDMLAQKHGLEKIKTIGDAYMVAGGLPVPRPDHDKAVVSFALDMLAALEKRRAWNDQPIRVRIGINTGPVVAGVIGRHKFIYDLWGDTVNTASRMESHGLGNSIQVTEATYQRLKDEYDFEARGVVNVKGKGDMNTYLLRGRKESLSISSGINQRENE
jgi:adenylate cyclase